jgi:hypothetical protein
MHRIGIQARATITHAAGGTTTLLDKPFSFEDVQHYENPGTLQPGDELRAECTFSNTTAAPVAFGQSTRQEMCYRGFPY